MKTQGRTTRVAVSVLLAFLMVFSPVGTVLAGAGPETTPPIEEPAASPVADPSATITASPVEASAEPTPEADLPTPEAAPSTDEPAGPTPAPEPTAPETTPPVEETAGPESTPQATAPQGDPAAADEPKTATAQGFFYAVVEGSGDGSATSELVMEPVKVPYHAGDTILDALNRLNGFTFTEGSGEAAEDGRVTINGKQYVAACDTRPGLIALRGTVAPEEANIVRIHQNTGDPAQLDRFPAALQGLIRSMAEYKDFERTNDDAAAKAAYDAAISGYAAAAAQPEEAEKLRKALDEAMAAAKAGGDEGPAALPGALMGTMGVGAETYVVSFDIRYAGIAVPGATITLTTEDNTQIVNTTGNYNFNLGAGYYTYTVQLQGYEISAGYFIVRAGQQGTLTVPVALIPQQSVRYPVRFSITSEGTAVTTPVLEVKNYAGAKVNPVSSADPYVYSLPRGEYTYTVSQNEIYTYINVNVPVYRDVYTTKTGTVTVEQGTDTQVFPIEIGPRIEYPWLEFYFGKKVTTLNSEDYYRNWISSIDRGTPYNANAVYTMSIPDVDFKALAIEAQNHSDSGVSVTLTYNTISSGQPVSLTLPVDGVYNPFTLLNDCIAKDKGGNRLTITAQSGGVTQVYNVDVVFQRTLKKLVVEVDGDQVPISPSFTPKVLDYTLEVPVGTDSVTIYPTAHMGANVGYSVAVNGTPVADGGGVTVPLSADPVKAIPVVVSHTDGQSTTYTVTVKQVAPQAHDLTFNVRTGADQSSQPITGASIEVKDSGGNVIQPKTPGGSVFSLMAGGYTYTVTAAGYLPNPMTGSVSVGDADRSLDVVLTQSTQTPLLQSLEVSRAQTSYSGGAPRTTTIQIQAGVFEYWADLDMASRYPYMCATLTPEAAADPSAKIVSTYQSTQSGLNGQATKEWTNGVRDNYLSLIGYMVGNVFTLDVTSFGVTQRYTIHLNRVPTLAGLNASVNNILVPLDPAFDAAGPGLLYETTVDQNAGSILVSPIVQADDYYGQGFMVQGSYTLTIDGVLLPDYVKQRTVKLGDVGTTKDIGITIRDKATGNSVTYTLRVHKVEKQYTPMLKTIQITMHNGLGWNPSPDLHFDPNTYAYDVDAGSDMYFLDVWADLADAYRGGTVELRFTTPDGYLNDYTFAGTTLPIYSNTLLVQNGPDNTLAIVATSADGTVSQTYTVHFTRTELLSSLTAYPDSDTTKSLVLSPAFAMHSFYYSTLYYKIIAPAGTQTVTLNAVPYDSADDLMLFDNQTFMGTATVPVSTDPMQQRHTIEVYREGEKSTVYTVDVLPSYDLTVTLTSGGQPLPNTGSALSVNVTDPDSGQVIRPNTDKTNALGAFGSFVYELPDGQYTYSTHYLGYAPKQGSFRVDGQNNAVTIDLVKYPPGPRTVTVNATYNGQPVPAAHIIVAQNQQGNSPYTPKSGANNVYILNDYDYDYYAIVLAPGCKKAVVPFRVEGVDVAVPVALETSPGAISGESRSVTFTLLNNGVPVKDAQGRDVVNVPITVDYFDLSGYYMQDYLYNETYDPVTRTWSVNDNEAVNPQPTMLQLMITAYRQLMGQAPVFGTSDLNLSKSGAGATGVLSYWGITKSMQYWYNYAKPGTPDMQVYRSEIPDGANITIDMYTGSTVANTYLIMANPVERTIPQSTMAQVTLNWTTDWGASAPPTSILPNNPLDIRRETSPGVWSDWQRLAETTDANGVANVFIEDPGTYQIRAGTPYYVSAMNTAGKLIASLYATVHVQEVPMQPVAATFNVTLEDVPYTDTASITVTNSKGVVQSPEAGTPGAFALMPGRYTYTVSTPDGQFPKSGAFIIQNGQAPVRFNIELRPALLLQSIDVNENNQGWNRAFHYDPDDRGVFDYTGYVYDTVSISGVSVRVALKSGVTASSITLKYTAHNSAQTPYNITLTSGDTAGKALSYLFNGPGQDINTFTIEVVTPTQTQDYNVTLKRTPTLKALGVLCNGIVTPTTPAFSYSAFQCEADVAEDAQTVTIKPAPYKAGYTVTVDGAPVTGSIDVPLNPGDEDTIIPIGVSYQDDGDYQEGVQSPTYYLTVKKTLEYEQADPLAEYLGFFTSSTMTNPAQYALDRPFNPAVYEYTLTIPEDTSSMYVQTAINADKRTGTTVTAKYFSSSTGNYAATAITTLDNTKRTTISSFNASGGPDGGVLNIEVKNGNVVQTYIFHLQLQRRLYSLAAKVAGEVSNLTLAPTFDRNVFAYDAQAAATAKSVNVTAGLVAATYYTLGYALTVNGQAVTANNTAVSVPLIGSDTVIPIIVQYMDADPVEYTLTVHRPATANVTFAVTPEGANVLLLDARNEILTPDPDADAPNKFLLSDGDTYTWVVTKTGYVGQQGTFTAQDGGVVTVDLVAAQTNPDIDPDLEEQWGSFRGNEDNNAVTDKPTPRNEDEAMLYWSVKAGEGEAWEGGKSASSQILVDGYLYLYSGTRLMKMDPMTGRIVASSPMVTTSSFSITPPAYGQGMIFVALAGGVVQAFDAKTLASLWVYHDMFGTAQGANQPNSPITYRSGYIYTGFWNQEAAYADMICLSVTDEDIATGYEEKLPTWVHPQKGGFYWAGAYAGDNFVLVGTDDGETGYQSPTSSLLSLSPVTGAPLDSVSGLNGDIRSTVMYDNGTGRFYFTSKGGSFYGVQVAANGKFVPGSLKEIKLGDAGMMCTSTPVVHNGRAYVGLGGSNQFGEYAGHGIVVIDLESMTIAYKANTKGYPQVSGVVSTAYGDEVYVYFVDNMTPGEVRVIRDKPGRTALADAVTESYVPATGPQAGQTVDVYNCAPVLFAPQGAQAQYAISSPIVDEYGTLYFKNDSNYIFAVGSAIDSIEVVQQPARTLYDEGDKFDPTGMKVVARLQNGLARDITRDISYTQGGLSSWDVSVTLYYNYVAYNNKGTAKKPETAVAVTVVTAADRERVRRTIELIAAIGEVTLEKEGAIQAARKSYNGVHAALKGEVTNYAALTQAEAALEQLKADEAAVQNVIGLIHDIGTVTLDKEDRIAAARAAYEALSDALKARVGPEEYQTLTDAEAALQELKEQEEEKKKLDEENAKKVAEVEDLIRAIGVVNATKGDAIQRARQAYDALPDDLKELVGNYNVLLIAEWAYASLGSGGSGTGGGNTGTIGDDEQGGNDQPAEGEGSAQPGGKIESPDGGGKEGNIDTEVKEEDGLNIITPESGVAGLSEDEGFDGTLDEVPEAIGEKLQPFVGMAGEGEAGGAPAVLIVIAAIAAAGALGAALLVMRRKGIRFGKGKKRERPAG